jgi:hypothetical protein
MATWKKVIVSGSNAELNQLNVGGANQIISGSAADTILSGSFSGSFSGSIQSFLSNTSTPHYVSYDTASGAFYYSTTSSFVATTASLALRTTGSLAKGAGIQMLSASVPVNSFDGSTNVDVAISGAAELFPNALTAWDAVDGKFINTGLYFSGSGTPLTASITDSGSVNGSQYAMSIELTGENTKLTGSFSGSFTGDGSKLTGLATVLQVSGSGTTDTGSLNLLSQALIITGSANAISASVISGSAGVTVKLGLDPNLIVSNLTVNNDLRVLGTASFENTQNLLVADRFVLFASGSTSAGDGGIVVQQGIQNVGELFGYENSVNRWGFTSSFSANSSTFTAAALVNTTETGTALPTADPLYGGAANGYGNMYVKTDTGDIFIYA